MLGRHKRGDLRVCKPIYLQKTSQLLGLLLPLDLADHGTANAAPSGPIHDLDSRAFGQLFQAGRNVSELSWSSLGGFNSLGLD